MNDYLALARQCVRCGLCLNSCPLSHTWAPWGETSTPRGKVTVLRRFFEGRLSLDEAARAELWYRCTTCKACEAACPVGVPITDLVLGARRLLVEEGKVPPQAAAALRSIRLFGNPWRRPPEERAVWAAGLGVKDLSRGEGAETVLYVGCFASYDPRGQRVARALAALLAAAGADFAILGQAEPCCGREVYSLGEEGLFAWLAEKNVDLFRRYGVRRVVTLSPHCYDAFKNLYPAFAEVWHYTEFLAMLVREARLNFRPGPFRRVSYHDPCHLSRYNGVVEAPRELLKGIPGLEILETDLSLCCEGGGGRMWLEAPAGTRSPAKELVSQAAALGAEVLAVACPFCLASLEGAALAAGVEEVPKVLDVAELLFNSFVREGTR